MHDTIQPFLIHLREICIITIEYLVGILFFKLKSQTEWECYTTSKLVKKNLRQNK